PPAAALAPILDPPLQPPREPRVAAAPHELPCRRTGRGGTEEAFGPHPRPLSQSWERGGRHGYGGDVGVPVPAPKRPPPDRPSPAQIARCAMSAIGGQRAAQPPETFNDRESGPNRYARRLRRG